MSDITIPVVMALNDAFARHAGVMIGSLLRHADSSCSFTFNIITGSSGLSRDNRARLEACIGGSPASINYLPINQERFASYPLTSYYTIETYYRLAITELLPDLDKCLYLDADLAILDDITALWRINLDGYAMAAVRDRALELSATRENTFRRLGLKCYFNAGVLVINLAWWRRHDVGANVRAFFPSKAQPY